MFPSLIFPFARNVELQRREVIFRESPLANEAHVLIAGIARITCLNASNERVTVALIAPGPIPELPSLPMSRFDFRCEAYDNCRVGTLDWKGFESVTLNGRESAFRKFHQNDLKHWYRLLRRTSGLLNLDLHERVAITMLDLCDDFGIEDSRGTLLPVSLSHKGHCQHCRRLTPQSHRAPGPDGARPPVVSAGTAVHRQRRKAFELFSRTGGLIRGPERSSWPRRFNICVEDEI
jgi:CRP-like cAMP-binding protein